jgi:hypothetical protein
MKMVIKILSILSNFTCGGNLLEGGLTSSSSTYVTIDNVEHFVYEATDQNVQTYATMGNDPSPYNWWECDLGGSKLVRSFFVEMRGDAILHDNYYFHVGDNSPPKFNALCLGAVTLSGWYYCGAPLIGTKFGHQRIDQNYSHI